jgi:hypothetical protein
MKALIFTALFLATFQGYAAQKCVIDGRTLYKNGPCPQGSAKHISGGTFSSLPMILTSTTGKR